MLKQYKPPWQFRIMAFMSGQHISVGFGVETLYLWGHEERQRDRERENSAALLHSLVCLYVHVLFVLNLDRSGRAAVPYN